jgi:amidase
MRTATDLLGAVRRGEVDPVSVVQNALARIASGHASLGAFRRVRHDEAIAEAQALKQRSGLAGLPLAGVPVAIEDVTAVARGSCHDGLNRVPPSASWVPTL